MEVVIGNSEGLATPRQVARLCNEAYGCGRLSEADARARLAMGDEAEANRVLHLAFREGQLLGCCSSTLQPPWTPRGCGHWGLLSVHPEVRGTGVASALIAAAERRLLEEGCSTSALKREGIGRPGAIQIEYEFTAGDPESQRLLQWYEGACGFRSGSPPPEKGSTFRCCRRPKASESLKVRSEAAHEGLGLQEAGQKGGRRLSDA